MGSQIYLYMRFIFHLLLFLADHVVIGMNRVYIPYNPVDKLNRFIRTQRHQQLHIQRPIFARHLRTTGTFLWNLKKMIKNHNLIILPVRTIRILAYLQKQLSEMTLHPSSARKHSNLISPTEFNLLLEGIFK